MNKKITKNTVGGNINRKTTTILKMYMVKLTYNNKVLKKYK